MPPLQLGLAHSLVMSSYSIECPLRLAMDDEEAEAKENEEYIRAAAKAWSCNHCPQFLLSDEAETRNAILEHLREV